MSEREERRSAGERKRRWKEGRRKWRRLARRIVAVWRVSGKGIESSGCGWGR